MVSFQSQPFIALEIFMLRRKSLYVYNKIDAVSLDYLDELAREPNTEVMSCELDLGIEDVVDRCWEELRLIRLYTKRSVQTHSSQSYQQN